MSPRLRAGLAIYAALTALLLVVSRVESLATGAAPPLAGADQLSRLTLYVRDAAGHPVDARVRISPATWREQIRLQRRDDLVGIADAGALTLELRAGMYRVFVSHGPEWTLAEFELSATPGVTTARAITIARDVSLPNWHAAELHVHTERSRDAAAHGGVNALDLRAEGVELAAITDHNQIGSLDGFDAVAGAEITTWAPEIGHFNAFPLHKLPRWSGTNPSALAKELLRDPGVFVQVNHPRLDDHIAYFALGGFDGARFTQPDFHLRVHGLEIWNGYDLARPERVHALLAEWRSLAARGERLTATGGSDSHGSSGHLPTYPRTYTRASKASDLATELRAGRAFVTNGPLLELDVNGCGPGERVRLREGATAAAAVRVQAPRWMRVDTLELWMDEQRVWSVNIPLPAAGDPLDWTARVELPAGQAKVVHAIARGGRGLERLLGRADVEPLAFTNAVELAR